MRSLKKVLVVEARDIEDLFEKEYGYTINLAQLFWEGDYMNDCYKSLYISPYDDEYENNDCNKVIQLLKNYGITDDQILVDVSW